MASRLSPAPNPVTAIRRRFRPPPSRGRGTRVASEKMRTGPSRSRTGTPSAWTTASTPASAAAMSSSFRASPGTALEVRVDRSILSAERAKARTPMPRGERRLHGLQADALLATDDEDMSHAMPD